MLDWFWLWLGGILQLRQLRRVEALEAAAERAMAEADPAPCYPQDCDAECPGLQCFGVHPEQLQNAFGTHDRLFAELYGAQVMRPQQMAQLQMQQMQGRRDLGSMLGGTLGTMVGGPMGGAFGSAFGNLFGGGRKH